MEENGENVPGEGELSPTEILERAKKENEKLGDERQRGRMQWGGYAGFIATVLAAVVVMIVETVVGDRLPTEIYAILFTGIAAQTVVQACFLHGKKARAVSAVCAALITACTLMYWVLWILGLCGVNI